MPEYYLAPSELITKGARQYTGSRIELYMDDSCVQSSLQPNAAVKQWCATALQAPQSVYDAIAADGVIVRIPVNALDRTWGELSAAVQNAITGALTNRRVPTDWITSATTVRQIIGYVLRCLDLTTRLGADFPEGDLTLRWDSLTTQQRTRILAWATANGISTSGINVNTALRVVVRRLIEQFNFQPFGLLGEIF